MTNVKNTLRNLILTAICMALGLTLPLLTGQIPQIGNMLLPMHIPVFLCAFICGWRYGLALGLILPILRSLTFGMPVLYPVAIAMTFELAAYGFTAGFIYQKVPCKCLLSLYGSMLIAMICGRLVLGLANIILYSVGDNAYTFSMFISASFIKAIPGILLQLVLVPAIIFALSKAKLVEFDLAAHKIS